MRKRDLAKFPKAQHHVCYHIQRYHAHLLALFDPDPNLGPRDVWRLCLPCLQEAQNYLKELCLDETE